MTERFRDHLDSLISRDLSTTEWWHPRTGEVLIDTVLHGIRKGLSTADAVDIVTDVAAVMMAEYGE